MISERLKIVKPSPVFEIAAKAVRMIKNGENVLRLDVGEPDTPVADHIKQAMINAVKNNKTRYTPVPGISDLQNAVALKYNNQYSSDEILITPGAKFALYATFQSIINNGDEVIIPSPYWTSYADIVKLSGGVPVFCSIENVPEHVNKKTKAIIINTPNNPSGEVYTENQIAACYKFFDGMVIFYEIYEYFVFEGKHFPLYKDYKNRSIVINGVSKTYAMTGLRIGFLLAPKEIAKAVSSMQSHATSNACSIAQYGALAALTGSQEHVKQMVETFRKRKDFLIPELNKIGLKCKMPKGAFYVLADCGLIDRDDKKATIKILEECKIATVPAADFGASGKIRFSYAQDMEKLRSCTERLKSYIEKAG